MIDRLEQDIKQSLLSGDRFRLSVLKMIKAALVNKRIEYRHELDQTEFMQVLTKELKQRNDTADIYRQAGDTARMAAEEKEAAIIQEYLPQQLSDEELAALIEQAQEELGGDKPLGTIIKRVIEKAEGRADGGRISQAIQTRIKES